MAQPCFVRAFVFGTLPFPKTLLGPGFASPKQAHDAFLYLDARGWNVRPFLPQGKALARRQQLEEELVEGNCLGETC